MIFDVTDSGSQEHPGRNGIDTLDLCPAKKCGPLVTLTIRTFQPVTNTNRTEKLHKANVRIERRGATPLPILSAKTQVAPEEPDTGEIHVTVRDPGDGLLYTLSLVEVSADGVPTGRPYPGFDPAYAAIDFRFRSGCARDRLRRRQRVHSRPSRAAAGDRLSRQGLRLVPPPAAGPPGSDRAELVRPGDPRPGSDAGRGAGLRRRPPQLLPGRRRHGSVPGDGAAARVGAAARAAGRLSDARGLQRPRLGLREG